MGIVGFIKTTKKTSVALQRGTIGTKPNSNSNLQSESNKSSVEVPSSRNPTNTTMSETLTVNSASIASPVQSRQQRVTSPGASQRHSVHTQGAHSNINTNAASAASPKRSSMYNSPMSPTDSVGYVYIVRILCTCFIPMLLYRMKSLPGNLQEDIRQFAIAGFAQQHFATHKKGIIFKKKVPLEKMLLWTKVGRIRMECLSSVLIIFIIRIPSINHSWFCRKPCTKMRLDASRLYRK